MIKGTPARQLRSGDIVSTQDLLGSTVLISEWSDELKYLRFGAIALDLNNGQMVLLAMNTCVQRPMKNFTFYECQTVQTAEEQQMFSHAMRSGPLPIFRPSRVP